MTVEMNRGKGQHDIKCQTAIVKNETKRNMKKKMVKGKRKKELYGIRQ